MHSLAKKLRSERERLVRQLAAIDNLLAAIPGRSQASGKRRRSSEAVRAGSLKDFILRVCKKGMGPVQLADAVKEAGYKTKNKNLPTSVGLAAAELTKAGKLRKLGRGRYAPRAGSLT